MKFRLNLTAARFVPALLLLSTILLLTLILASLGRQALDREKRLLLSLKERQARTMVRSIASASRISAMIGERARQLDRFVADAAQTEDVIFIAVYDSRGHLITASPGFERDDQGLTINEMRQKLAGMDYVSTVTPFGGLGRVFLHIGRFNPLDSPWVHLRMLEIPRIPGITEGGADDQEEIYNYVLIGMGIEDLDSAVAKGMRQALLNGFLLLLLGSIGFYFLILVQGYYSTRKALADFRQYTLEVIEGMAEGFINVDHQGVLRTINPEAESILGISARDFIGKPWRDLFREDEWERVSALLADGTPFYDLEIPPGASARPYMKTTMIPVRGQGGGQGMVLFLRDMGEVKGLQAEVRRSERLAALGRLVAGMAHEIRNPLNSIRGFSQHLKARFSADTQEGRALEVIVREVDRLNRVITELLDFSRPREPRMESLDLNDVVRSTISLVEREAGSQGITLVLELAETPGRITGDEDSLKQLLLNLLLNGLQAMPDGGILTVGTGSSGGRVYLSVTDTGVGIAEEDQEKIFEPFFTTRDKGTGLGLAIVHRIVLDHGGEIRVESRPSKGTTFTVRFPEAPTEA